MGYTSILTAILISPSILFSTYSLTDRTLNNKREEKQNAFPLFKRIV